ncbi:phBC6A51 family helix-turn-helix protein [Heyndrickxia coagulans]|uniref:phBC6A51 family helix-turn-helix protein n=1 Tax=Heyndrickxia coagulans TaxID=1398 RepID=UPI000304AFB7|nr:phBC6A51 family helix-turn-helix protein [Heyndrickxia coagulans]
MITTDELKERLTPQQLQAAELLVQNEFAGKEKRTQEELAEEVGISRMQLYKWRTENTYFAEYVRRKADAKLNALSVMVDAKLVSLIDGSQWNNGIPSIRAIELFYKRFGLLVDRKEITAIDGQKPKRLTKEEVERGLNELSEMLSGKA